MNAQMKFGSVCSGIEAASCAWNPLGWRAQFVSEIESFPSAVLAHHYPDVPNLGDMTKFKEWPDAAIDLLVGGTPCQSFSVAGLRKGLDDPRGNLMLTYLALAARFAPRWLVWENVPGVLSSNGGKDFGTFLGGLAELGYGFAYRILDAQFFGVAQRRRRVFVVGYLGDWRRAAAVLFERESLLGNPAPRREAGQRIVATLTRGAESSGKGGYAGRRQEDDVNIVQVAPTLSARTRGGGGLGTDFECDGGLIAQAFGGNNTSGPIEVATAVNACSSASGRIDFESETFIAHALRVENVDGSEDDPGGGTPIVPVSFAENSRGEIRFENGDGARTGALLTGGGKPGQGAQMIAFQTRGSNIDVGQISGTLGTNSDRASGSAPMISGSAVRRLTPRECERLQGFPDDYTAISVRGKAAADGPRYKALGNSMAVPVMRWIGERIQLVEDTFNA